MSRLPDPFDSAKNIWADPPGANYGAAQPDPNRKDTTPLDRAVETAVLRGLFGTDRTRRSFLRAVGRRAAASAVAASFPLDAAKAVAREGLKPSLEKKRLRLGFVPITCSAPLIAAEPLGFYRANGLEVELVRTLGWAAARDNCLSGVFDASHLMAPMPLAMTVGLGHAEMPMIVPAVQNTNGQALVLANRHQSQRDPKLWKGFRLAVPFAYSMHNLLLRFYLAQHDLDPDRDVQIRVVPPPQMVECLADGSVDGYLGPDPYCQRAVYDGVGFIHLLTKDLMPQHPCCVFACSRDFARENPNTFLALYKAVLASIEFCAPTENRSAVAEAIHQAPYLDQPLSVVDQVMTGIYEDGLGQTRRDPDRIHFAPLPTQAMADWILAQMKRWGYLRSEANYATLAHDVYLSTGTASLLAEAGQQPNSTHLGS